MVVSVAFRKCRVAGRCVGDRVVVLGGDGPADADGADDVAVLDDRHATLAEDEAIVAERGHVVGEEHALAEALLEVERGGLKASRGVGLGPRDLEERFSKRIDRKSTRLNSSHVRISYAVFCLKKKKKKKRQFY